VNVKEITCLLRWWEKWEKYETLFPTVGFLVWQNLGIVGSQIEIKRIFFSVGILINLRRCHVQLYKFKKLIFVKKNWANGFKIGYKSLFDLIELIGIDANLKKRLEQFEGAFERNEIVNI